MSRLVRVGATLVVTALAVLYLAWKIEVSEAVDILSDASFGYILAAWVLMVVTTVPMAWRWRELLRVKGVTDRLTWITRTYFVSYTAGQVLPTSIGGDAMRVYETSRRHPGRLGLITGTVLLDRALGGAATLALAAVGFAFALGSYDVGAYLWVELVLVAVTVVAGFALFSQAVRRRLGRIGPLVARLRLERPLKAVYEAMHSYRTEARLLVVLFGVTLVVQAIRILPIWLCAKAVGIDLSVKPYYVFGPILFVVLLFPFTINGIAVREAFFVSFLGNLGVDADRAFAAGFLFFIVTVALAAPGALVLLWEAVRPPVREADPGRGSGRTGRFPSDRLGAAMADVSVVVVTYDAMPYLERCLESVSGYELIVVDHGSTDGSLELVRERFPHARVIEQENRGFGAGMNAGMRAASGRYFLLLNPDAWVLDEGVEKLRAFADEHPDAGVIGPRLLNPDGSLQPSVRGFTTTWRLATEYFFLRKLLPRSRLFNSFFGAGFDHRSVLEAEWLGGACLLVRRESADAVGLFDENFFLFSEEVDLCYRFRQAGWKVVFFPDAEVVHVFGASYNPALFQELLRSHLRFLAKHRGADVAERARRLLLVALRVRGVLFRGRRRPVYRKAACWLASGSAAALIEEQR